MAKVWIDRIKDCGLILSRVPKEFITEELCEIAVSNSDSLYLVPINLRTYKVCLAAIKHCKEAKAYIPIQHQIGEIAKIIEMYEAKPKRLVPIDEVEYISPTIKKAPYNFGTFRDSNGNIYEPRQSDFEYSESKKYSTPTTVEEALEIVKTDDFGLMSIPQHLRTYKVCLEAVMRRGFQMSHVPPEHGTYEMYLIACNNGYSDLYFVPDKHKTLELCEAAIKSSVSCLKDVPNIFKSKDMCLYCLSLYSWALPDIPVEYLTTEMCEDAIRRNPDKYLYAKVPSHLLNEQMKKYIEIEEIEKKSRPQMKQLTGGDHYHHYPPQPINMNEIASTYRPKLVCAEPISETKGQIKKLTGNDQYPSPKANSPSEHIEPLCAKNPDLAKIFSDAWNDAPQVVKDHYIKNYGPYPINDQEPFIHPSFLAKDPSFHYRYADFEHKAKVYNDLVEACLKYINNKQITLKDIHHELRTFEVCLAAVKNNGSDYEYVPHFHTILLVTEAMKNGYIPESWNNKASLLSALEMSPDVLPIIPAEFLTVELCQDAIRRNPDIKLYSKVPEHLKNDIMKKYVEDAIRQNKEH
jgi:hypothetical protein